MSEYSILDKVMTSRVNQERADFNPQEIISALLKILSTKEEDILRRRHGLNGKQSETLEAIGKLYNVTRERIRQIENVAIGKIKGEKQFQKQIDAVQHPVLVILREEGGGIMEEDYLLEKLLGLSSDTLASRYSILFLLTYFLDDKVEQHRPTDTLKQGWKMKTTPLGFSESLIEALHEIFVQRNEPLPAEHVWEHFEKTPFAATHAARLSPAIVNAHLELSQHIDRNPFSEYGLRAWGSIVPKRMNDKIYLILKRQGEPMHFNDITSAINKVKFDHRKAYPPTVHNELILNDRYVLVGRGVYALKEWGYKPGIVSEVIKDILGQTPNGFTRDEIMQKVLEQRVVKKNTIYLALTNKETFEKMSDGRYRLKVTS